MPLRARKPQAVTKRLKLFMFGPAGVGKTTAAIQFPNSYIVDCERGAENYAKTEYGENLRKLGYTFDGWRQLDYWFDLVVELTKKGKKRMGKVVKTRIETFPDDDVFEWSYEAIKSRYDAATLEREANVMQLASPQQIAEIR